MGMGEHGRATGDDGGQGALRRKALTGPRRRTRRGGLVRGRPGRVGRTASEQGVGCAHRLGVLSPDRVDVDPFVVITADDAAWAEGARPRRHYRVTQCSMDGTTTHRDRRRRHLHREAGRRPLRREEPAAAGSRGVASHGGPLAHRGTGGGRRSTRAPPLSHEPNVVAEGGSPSVIPVREEHEPTNTHQHRLRPSAGDRHGRRCHSRWRSRRARPTTSRYPDLAMARLADFDVVNANGQLQLRVRRQSSMSGTGRSS